MSKPFKTFIAILIISSIAATSAQQITNSTGPLAAAPDGNSSSLASIGSSNSGNGGGGLVDSIISLPATILSVILSPIRALLTLILGGVGDILGSTFNLVFGLLRTILSPIFSILGLPVDAVEYIAGGVGGLVREILTVVFTDILGVGGRSTVTPAATVLTTPAPRVRRDLVMNTLMDITSYVNSIIQSFLLNLSDSTQDAATEMIHWGWSWAKQVLLPSVDQFLVKAMNSSWISTDMARWFNDLHEMYAWLHIFGIV